MWVQLEHPYNSPSPPSRTLLSLHMPQTELQCVPLVTSMKPVDSFFTKA